MFLKLLKIVYSNLLIGQIMILPYLLLFWQVKENSYISNNGLMKELILLEIILSKLF